MVNARVKVMIKSFKDKLLEKLFNGDTPSTTNQQEKIRKRLEVIDSASKVESIRLIGYDLHELKGNRKGIWSIKTKGNWRITFRFKDGHAYDVNHEDYH